MNKVFQSKSFFISSLIILHALFFLYAVHSEKIYIPKDSAEYLTLAYNLSHHHTWYSGNLNQPVNDYYYSHVSPLTGFFITSVKFIYNSDEAICFAQCLLSIFNFLIVIKCIRLFYPSWKYDFV